VAHCQDNPDAADRLLDSIDERCTTLAQFPYIAAVRQRRCVAGHLEVGVLKDVFVAVAET